MFSMEDREIASGGLSMENGCFEKMRRDDSVVSVRQSPAYVRSPGLDAVRRRCAHLSLSFLLKSLAVLIQ